MTSEQPTVDDISDVTIDSWETNQIDDYHIIFEKESLPVAIEIMGPNRGNDVNSWEVTLCAYNTMRGMMDLHSSSKIHQNHTSDVNNKIIEYVNLVESGEFDDLEQHN